MTSNKKHYRNQKFDSANSNEIGSFSSSGSSSLNTSSTLTPISNSQQSTSQSRTSRGPLLEPIPQKHVCTSQNTAARLAAHHSTIGASANSLQRPTEAQLRWAQFHSKARAKNTRAKVDKLLQTPVENVVGATKRDYESSDTSSVSESSSEEENIEDDSTTMNSPSFAELRKVFDGNKMSENKEKSKQKKKQKDKRKTKRKKRPTISRGRRALLRVSQRAYIKRRESTKSNFETDEYNDDDYNDNFSISSHSRRIVRGTNRPSVLQRDDEDVEQRLQRFEEAYIAMATVHEQQEDDDITVNTTTTKRWKRPQHLVAHIDPLNLDGRDFDDEQSLSRIPSKNIVYRSNFVFSQKIDGVQHGKSLLITTKNNVRKADRKKLLQSLQDSAEKRKQTPRKRNSSDSTKLITNESSEDLQDVSKALFDTQDYVDELPEQLESALQISKSSDKSSHKFSSLKTFNDLKSASVSLKTLSDLKSTSIMSLSSDFLKKVTTQIAGRNVIDSDSQHENEIMKQNMSTLLLSPTIITKRHRQAIHAIMNRQWKDTTYLLNANPWLAEMTDVISSQLLLHHLASHGSEAPKELNALMLHLFEDGVHKFDKMGNLPMHMAASSGNMNMLRALSDKFKGGANVRNEEGMLPLHLAVLSQSIEAVKFVVNIFPDGLAIADGDGNLPLHLCSLLDEKNGIEIIQILLEHDKGVKTWFEEKENGEVVDFKEVFIPSGLVQNSAGNTPIISGIKNSCGWEILEALMSGNGGHEAAQNFDESGNAALHLVISGEYADAASALAILKCIPVTVSISNKDGLLPIEIACMNNMPREVLLGLLLVDLPVDLDDLNSPEIVSGRGMSWWYITCDCDDAFPHIIREVLTLCNHKQTRELCFMEGGASRKGSSLIRCATPQSRIEMRRALRFVGRYEFTQSAAIHSDNSRGLKVFDAMDFFEHEDGKKIYLYCFSIEEAYEKEINLLKSIHLSPEFIEESHLFTTNEYAGHLATETLPTQFCYAVEKPGLTLSRIVEGMPKDHDYRQNMDKFNIYLKKVCNVLRSVVKAIKYLHEQGIVHGDIGPHTCGKCGDKWKLLNVHESKLIGGQFKFSRLGEYSPPEVVEFIKDEKGGETIPQFKKSHIASISQDIWAFGKLCYEVFVGEVLIDFDSQIQTCKDLDGLYDLGAWCDRDLTYVVESLIESGVGHEGADLVRKCLSVDKNDRPSDMNEVLNHPFWKISRRKRNVEDQMHPMKESTLLLANEI